MDHLKTSEERQARWYASQLFPRFLPIRDADSLEDVLEEDTDAIRAIPSDWLVDGIGGTVLDAILERDGFAVVTGVLTDTECETSLNLANEWLQAAIFSENAILGSQCDRVNWPACVEGGMIPFYGAGHSSFSWFVRSRRKVRLAFEALHKTTALAASFDGVVLWRHGQVTDRGWFHLDQNPERKPHRACFQGMVNLLTATSSTGGNVMVAKSHLHFPDNYTEDGHGCSSFYRARLHELEGDDWLEIDPNDKTILQPDRIVSAELRAGDMILWDSRTVHCSYPGKGSIPPSDKSDFSDSGLIRAAVAVCMMPRSTIAADVEQERIQAVNNSRTLTHWVDKSCSLGAERTEEMKRELSRIYHVREWEKMQRKKVLLELGDLTAEQLDLV